MKKKLLMNMRNPVIQRNPIIVPTMPKNTTIAKFSKNNDFLKLYPAENIIGGKIMVKNISLFIILLFMMKFYK